MTDTEKAIQLIKAILLTAEANGAALVQGSHFEALHIALSALCEKMEKEKGCEYCKPCCHNCKHDLYDDFCSFYGTHGCDNKHFEPKSKFCPMCGRKLGENDG